MMMMLLINDVQITPEMFVIIVYGIKIVKCVNGNQKEKKKKQANICKRKTAGHEREK